MLLIPCSKYILLNQRKLVLSLADLADLGEARGLRYWSVLGFLLGLLWIGGTSNEVWAKSDQSNGSSKLKVNFIGALNTTHWVMAQQNDIMGETLFASNLTGEDQVADVEGARTEASDPAPTESGEGTLRAKPVEPAAKEAEPNLDEAAEFSPKVDKPAAALTEEFNSQPVRRRRVRSKKRARKRFKRFKVHGTSGLSLTTTNLPSRLGGEDEESVDFSLEPLDLLLSQRVNSELELFSEIIFDWSESRNQGDVTVDRLWMDYRFSRGFGIKAGRFHRALGYRSSLDFHGAPHFISVSSPMAYEAPSDGGALPLHATGVEFHGNWTPGASLVGYHLSASNGRGGEVKDQQVTTDEDKEKSFSAAFYYGYPYWAGFRLGWSYHQGTLPGRDTNADKIADQGLGREVVTGAHLVLGTGLSPDTGWGSGWQFLVEGFNISHEFRTGETRSQYKVIYGQLAFFFFHQALLLRYGLIDPELGVKLQDPYYLGSVVAQQVSRGTLGWRVQWSERLQLKLELQKRIYKKDDLTDTKGVLNISYFW